MLSNNIKFIRFLVNELKRAKTQMIPFYCEYNISWSGALILGLVVLGLQEPCHSSSKRRAPPPSSRRHPDELPCFWVKWCEGTDKFGPELGETKHSQRGMSLFWRSSGGFLCTQLLSGRRAASALDPSSTPFTAFLHDQVYATHAETEIDLYFFYHFMDVSQSHSIALSLLWPFFSLRLFSCYFILLQYFVSSSWNLIKTFLALIILVTL